VRLHVDSSEESFVKVSGTPKGVRSKVRQVHHVIITDEKMLTIRHLFVLAQLLYLLHWLESFLTEIFIECYTYIHALIYCIF